MVPTWLLVAVAGFGLLRDPVTLVALLVACLVVTFLLYVVWVPLMADELSTARIVEAGRTRIAARKRAQDVSSSAHQPVSAAPHCTAPATCRSAAPAATTPPPASHP